MSSLVDLQRLNPSQREILRLIESDSLIAWIGAVRSGKGVGTAHALLQLSVRKAREEGRALTYILAGSTSGSFLANNLEYLIDISEQAGLSAQYTTGDGQPRVEVKLADTLIAAMRVYGGGNARSHFALRGLTAHSAWIDEATLVHPDFIRTAIQRCSYSDSRVILTSNTGTPTHALKVDYIDSGAATLLETDFHENVHYPEERRAELLGLNPNTADYARAIQNQWAAEEGVIIPIMPEHYDSDTAPETIGTVVIDQGTAGTTAALLFQRTDYGWLVADEYYHVAARQGGLTDREHLIRIFSKWQGMKVIIDPAAAQMRADAHRLGLNPLGANNQFERGVQVTNNALYAGKLRVNPKCRNLLTEAGGYVWNPSESAPVPTAPDHLMDCLRYGALDKFPAFATTLLF